MNSIKLRLLTTCAALSLAGGLPGAAAAQDAQPAGGEQRQIEEIIVTAERRESTVQKTPLAITAIAGDDLQARQLNSITDIQGNVPGFRIGQLTGGAVISIRGIGIASVTPETEGTAAVNINDVYVARIVAQPLAFYDVSSLEVLRGPQGTLYGRNATSGALNIRTTLPTSDLSGYGRLTVGNYHTINAEGAIGGALAGDWLLARVAGRVEHHGGYWRNIANGHRIDDRDTWSARGTLVATPTPDLKVTVFAEIGREDDNAGAAHFFGGGQQTGQPGTTGVPPLFVLLGGAIPSLREVSTDITPVNVLETESVIGNVEWNPDENITLRSITGYRHVKNSQVFGYDPGSPTSGMLVLGQKSNQITQELQLLYSGTLADVTLGAYYFNERQKMDPADSLVRSDLLELLCPIFVPIPGYTCPALPGAPYFTEALPARAIIKTRSWAAFGQVDLHVTDRFTLTAGLRHTIERKYIAQDLTPDFSNLNPILPPYDDFSQFRPTTFGPSRSARFSSTTPKLGVQFEVDPRTMLYASYSKGFKSGGFEISSLTPPFEPEVLTAYEGGVKTRLFDNRATFNLAGFLYKYDDLQVQQNEGFFQVTRNAAKATIYGLEGEASILVSDALRLDVNAAYNHSKYDEYVGTDSEFPGVPIDYTGKRLNNAPRFSGQVAAEYTVPTANGNVSLRGELQYSSRYYFTPSNIDMKSQDEFAKGNLFLTYHDDANWRVQLFVRNVTNKLTRQSYSNPGNLLGSPFFGSVSAPRLIGLDFKYDF